MCDDPREAVGAGCFVHVCGSIAVDKRSIKNGHLSVGASYVFTLYA